MGAGWYYRHSNPPMCRMALRTLARITGPSTGGAVAGVHQRRR
jgi:hypothetical protein